LKKRVEAAFTVYDLWQSRNRYRCRPQHALFNRWIASVGATSLISDLFTDVGSLFAGVLIAIGATFAGFIALSAKLANIFLTFTQFAPALFIGLRLAGRKDIGDF
jgi:hypothetical protein